MRLGARNVARQQQRACRSVPPPCERLGLVAAGHDVKWAVRTSRGAQAPFGAEELILLYQIPVKH